MAYEHLDGNERISESYHKINDNFDQVDEEITAHKTAAILDHPDGSVTTVKVADKAIVRAKIGDKAVGTGQLGDKAVTAAQLADGAVGSGQLGPGAATDTVIGDRTITDTAAPTGTTGTLTALFGWIANMIKGITGKSSWSTAPATTLEEAKQHIDNSDIHTTATEKNKLAGIQSGAEVNQNTFSIIRVSGQGDVVADDKSDVLTFSGGTGITVSTNPTNDTLTITATGEATPGAHASSHLTGGSDPIPLATISASGLMSEVDKSTLDGLSGEFSDLQEIVEELDEKSVRIYLSESPPEEPNINTFWYQDFGQASNLGSELLIGNASTDQGEKVWFDEIE